MCCTYPLIRGNSKATNDLLGKTSLFLKNFQILKPNQKYQGGFVKFERNKRPSERSSSFPSLPKHPIPFPTPHRIPMLGPPRKPHHPYKPSATAPPPHAIPTASSAPSPDGATLPKYSHSRNRTTFRAPPTPVATAAQLSHSCLDGTMLAQDLL